MDPGLWELVEAAPGETVEAVIRLDGPPPPEVRLVSRFGPFATCRLPADLIPQIRDAPSVVTLKAPRRIGPEVAMEVATSVDVSSTDLRRSPDLPATGRGVVVGVVDWGCDITHPDFKLPTGATRLLALWDQRGEDRARPNPWGYGRIHWSADIDEALSTSDPHGRLGYQVHSSGRADRPAHGTHVLSIASGSGQAGGPSGMAPETSLVFVHLGGSLRGGPGDLGDSVRILEAIDFVFRVAGRKPVVVNLSVGAQGGSHDGLTAVEQAIDAALTERPGRALVQSTGNYFAARGHAAADLRPGERWTLEWRVFPGDLTPNELEIWYPGTDELEVTVGSPDGRTIACVPLGERSELVLDGRRVGRIYHRRHDPNNGDHHIDCFLYSDAPPGRWRVSLEAMDVADGRCRAWIERDDPRPPHQSMFDPRQAQPFGTTGTIANGLRPIAVGAYDPHSPGEPLASFSSAGPTRDGRQKPDLIAPGVASLAARSGGGLTRMSGTSMASPVVAGTVACMFEAARRPLTVAESRTALLGTARLLEADDHRRVGSGRLDPYGAIDMARRIGGGAV